MRGARGKNVSAVKRRNRDGYSEYDFAQHTWLHPSSLPATSSIDSISIELAGCAIPDCKMIGYSASPEINIILQQFADAIKEIQQKITCIPFQNIA